MLVKLFYNENITYSSMCIQFHPYCVAKKTENKSSHVIDFFTKKKVSATPIYYNYTRECMRSFDLCFYHQDVTSKINDYFIR